MRSIGFLSPRKENEHRVAILPADMESLAHPEALHIEAGYGVAHAVADADYAATWANVCARLDAYECDVICSPKLPPKDEFKLFRPGRPPSRTRSARSTGSFTTRSTTRRRSSTERPRAPSDRRRTWHNENAWQ